MTEVVRPRDGEPVTLRPWPPWCILGRHFAAGQVIHVGDGCRHCGPAAPNHAGAPGVIKQAKTPALQSL